MKKDFNQKEESSNSKGTTQSKRRPRDRRSSGKTHSTGRTEKNTLPGVQLALDVTQFPFSGALGRTINMTDNVTDTVGLTHDHSLILPGVCGIYTSPNMGSPNGISSINLAARNLYSYVTHANSRNASYEATDLMIYVMAVTEIFKMWQFGVRLYGIARSYTVMNKYMPKALVEACGISYDSLMDNLNDFRASLNLLASQISTLVIPSGMAYTLREFAMFSQVYADSENSRAQMYIIAPDSYYLYHDILTETGGGLEMREFNNHSTLLTTSQYINMMREMVANVLNSQYMNIMAADIIKAFGDQIFSLPEVSEDYVVLPIYDPEFLEVINNIKPVGKPSVLEALDGVPDEMIGKLSGSVYQKIPDTVDSAPTLFSNYLVKENLYTNLVYELKNWLNTDKEKLDPNEVIDRTTFMPIFRPSLNDKFRVVGRTNVVSSIYIFNSPSNVADNIYFVVPVMAPGSPLGVYATINQFHKFPVMMGCKGVDTAPEIHGFVGDVNNLSVISDNDLENLNEVVTQIIFNYKM